MKLESCEPPRWANTGHAQTILGHLLPSPRLQHKGRQVELPLADGDRLVVFVEEGSSNTVVYIFHGLAGSTDSTYMHRTSTLAQKLGHTVIMANHRGCGEGVGLAKMPYHSGRAEDLSAVIAMGREMFPKKNHIAIGFSLSGNALLLLLSGRRGSVKPDAGVSVNAPIHLAESSKALGAGLNRIYDMKFYRQCRKDIMRAIERGEWRGTIPRFSTIYEFDQLYTAPVGGFKDRDDYYSSCSTYLLLPQITAPTVILTADDDPFVPVQSYRNAHLSSAVHLHIERCGGHMGYIHRGNTPYGGRRWQDYALVEALKFLLK